LGKKLRIGEHYIVICTGALGGGVLLLTLKVKCPTTVGFLSTNLKLKINRSQKKSKRRKYG
jgi:hypothetical protein